MNSRSLDSVLITGGCGFIGSNFIRFLFERKEFNGRIINLDLLTYAGNPLSLQDIESDYGKNRYHFIHGDISDRGLINRILTEFQVDTVVHFAAESHVDRSIDGPADFINTNIIGTFTLLEEFRQYQQKHQNPDTLLFHHISTDEVYGSLGKSGSFSEESPYNPRSPYSASKAASDHLVSAYYHTYNVPVTISNCSNNYGPYQFPEKMIPLMIMNIHEGKSLPVYGDGSNIRDWVHVDDHNFGIWLIINQPKRGVTFNIGGGNERTNLDLVKEICQIYSELKGKNYTDLEKAITFVKDRPGHDQRYAINNQKITSELGWKQTYSFQEGLKSTIIWYLEHLDWIKSIRNQDYLKWIDRNYANR